MGGKPVGIVLLLLASGGCHACQSCCDYLPPVADSPYSVPGQRAGSAFGGGPKPSYLQPAEPSANESSSVEPVNAEINLTPQALLEIDQ
jgi:hypothetical protein